MKRDLRDVKVPITLEFFARWCGLTVEQTREGLDELLAMGFLREVGKTAEGEMLYALGEAAFATRR